MMPLVHNLKKGVQPTDSDTLAINSVKQVLLDELNSRFCCEPTSVYVQASLLDPSFRYLPFLEPA